MTDVLIRLPTGCRIWCDAGKKSCTCCSTTQTPDVTRQQFGYRITSEVSSFENTLMETYWVHIINPVTKDYGLSLNTVVVLTDFIIFRYIVII